MGFFDRFKSSPKPASDAPNTTPASAAPVSPLTASLQAARRHLESRDLPAAMAVYEDVLSVHGDRADVLVTISGDLGSCGYIEPIIELIAPRYDADRHGPATGLNVLQAYLALRNPTAARHILDLLFGLNRPELEERLHGFSNALAELLEAERTGKLEVPPSAAADAPSSRLSTASISKPIWIYGLEPLGDLLCPRAAKPRRVAFGQLALPGLADFEEKLRDPSYALGRFSRGFALWLAETMTYSPHYRPIAAIALIKGERTGLFPTEWSTRNIRELADSATEGLDFIFSGTLRETGGDFELTLKLWELKKFTERKTFQVRWTPANADAVLSGLQAQLRQFLEWSDGAGPLLWQEPASPTVWIDALALSLDAFLATKDAVAPDNLVLPEPSLNAFASLAGKNEAAALAWITLAQRAAAVGKPLSLSPTLIDTPLVARAREL